MFTPYDIVYHNTKSKRLDFEYLLIDHRDETKDSSIFLYHINKGMKNRSDKSKKLHFENEMQFCVLSILRCTFNLGLLYVQPLA